MKLVLRDESGKVKDLVNVKDNKQMQKRLSEIALFLNDGDSITLECNDFPQDN